jgi:hypothetical protein
MRFSDMDIDELLDIINNPDSDPELRERAARFIKRRMDIDVYGE